MTPNEPIRKTDEEWREQLSPLAYHVTREKGTERPFTGVYNDHDEPGLYRCVSCGEPLFRSDTKYHSGSGWPSFFEPAGDGKIETRTDQSHGMQRTEVLCGRCGAHLGHLFPDGPQPTGLRYCINSAALDFEGE
ncbi:MAG TPA: peptide-methionine (R)-S-oxide reductase MsrB [Anaerolineales bacterium]|nr:peptide-methionine (R)-S-oxide reductase MsrB [Anaerolineales bacterium]